ncbi:MAG: hypothetical protein QGF59_15210 [Pirellulaceae bacterium]|jgi:hypothetical protein|nr:hypothetical protein [Pirellulaceae bacterium]MDP6720008.1 hypothetical protein [Pirellulaceae bacterium]
MLKRDPNRRTSTHSLQVILRAFGVMDMLAFIAVVMPAAWLETGHQWAGLGTFPDAPVAAYLARSASLMYGLHGMLLFLLATDTVRYRRLIRWIAGVTVIHGGFMLTIDLVEQMPLWWVLVEGPAFSLTGIVILVAQRFTNGVERTDDSV